MWEKIEMQFWQQNPDPYSRYGSGSSYSNEYGSGSTTLFTAIVTWRKRYKNPGLSTTILQYGGSGGAADKAVLNQKKSERKRTKKVSLSLMSPLLIKPLLFAPIKKNSTRESPFKFCFPRCLSTISTVCMFSCFNVSASSLRNLFAIYAPTEQEK